MPIFFTENNEYYRLVVWKLLDTENFNDVKLSNESLEKIDSLKKEIHRKQFLATRKIFNVLGLEDKDIEYGDNGKPYFLIEKKYISITHSGDFSAVVISKANVGIDLETKFNKILKVRDKFLSEKEKNIFSEIDLVRVWCTKESIYKLLERKKSIREIELNDKFVFRNDIVTKNIKYEEFYLCVSFNIF